MGSESQVVYPVRLQELINFFEHLSDAEKRENLIAYADQALLYEPRNDISYTLEDVRRDQECTDTVGIYLNVSEEGRVSFRVHLGSQVQTLTRAMAAILCEGLSDVTPEEVLNVPQDFVSKIVGSELVRIRSQTVYYVLTRMKGVCKVYLDRHR